MKFLASRAPAPPLLRSHILLSRHCTVGSTAESGPHRRLRFYGFSFCSHDFNLAVMLKATWPLNYAFRQSTRRNSHGFSYLTGYHRWLHSRHHSYHHRFDHQKLGLNPDPTKRPDFLNVFPISSLSPWRLCRNAELTHICHPESVARDLVVSAKCQEGFLGCASK